MEEEQKVNELRHWECCNVGNFSSSGKVQCPRSLESSDVMIVPLLMTSVVVVAVIVIMKELQKTAIKDTVHIL